MLHWFEAFVAGDNAPAAVDYVVSPPAGQRGGPRATADSCDLLASHLGLIDVDLDLAAYVGGSRFLTRHPRFLSVHRVLADALADPAFDGYDVVLIDCAPNFNMVTRTAVVASDHLVIPARPDYLSTLGIDYLRRKLAELVRDYNIAAGADEIGPTILGVVFTMIQFAGRRPRSSPCATTSPRPSSTRCRSSAR